MTISHFPEGVSLYERPISPNFIPYVRNLDLIYQPNVLSLRGVRSVFLISNFGPLFYWGFEPTTPDIFPHGVV